MSRAPAALLRPLAVWLAVTGATALAVAVLPGAWSATGLATGPATGSATGVDAVADLVVAACGTALAVALGWWWLVTTATVVDLARGRVTTGGATRRLVLLACGVAVAAGTGIPAAGAAGGDGHELLAGLALPDRAVAPVRHRTTPPPAHPEGPDPAPRGAYVVRPGDSLSSIALAHPGTGSLDERWRRIWRANRDVVGDDPDLILPGQELHLPGPTDHIPEIPGDQDGDRP